MIWLLITLQILFWIPMVLRVARRRTPEITFQRELIPRWREPGLLLYQLAIPLIWAGFVVAFRHHQIPISPAQIAAGALLHVLAATLFAWSVDVHRSWNIQARLEPDHQLCTQGPYRFVRHPIYLAFNLIALGSAIWVPHPLVIAGALMLIAGGEIRARAEERILQEKFGNVYRNYMRRVRRTIPAIY